MSDAGNSLLLPLYEVLRIPVPDLLSGETLADVAARIEAISDSQFSDWLTATKMHSDASLLTDVEFVFELQALSRLLTSWLASSTRR